MTTMATTSPRRAAPNASRTSWLRSTVFSRLTAWVGLVFGVLSLVPASAGTIGIAFSLLSLIPMWMWLVLVARRLLQLARSGGAPVPRPAVAPRAGAFLPQH